MIVRSSQRILVFPAVAWALLNASLVVQAAESSKTPDTEADLVKLKNSSADIRLEALRDLQTSLDLRIPDAILPLLSDEGNSIRRLAARAIGSRWWQIAKERVPEVVTALRRNDKTEFEDEKNMIDRALGLLTGDYNSGMFVRSANKRWVIYERRARPCLIDTQTGTEELLGWPPDEGAGLELLLAAFGNSTLKDSVTWHPTKEAVVFSVLETRRATMLWVWQHRLGLRKLARADIMKTLGLKEPITEPNPVTAELKEWKADELYVLVGYGQEGHAVLSWNPSKNTLRVISRGRLRSD